MGRVRSVFVTGAGRGSGLERRRLALALLVLALILVVVNVAGWRVHAAMRHTLEGELGQRLTAIAAAAAQPIDPDYVQEMLADPEAFGALIVRDRFQRLQQSLSVSNLVLMSTDGRALVDLNPTTAVGEPHPLSILHRDAFTAARSGIAATSGLYVSMGSRYKNGYAPVTDDAGNVVGVVAVEVGAPFFDALTDIRRMFLVAGVASVAAIGLLGLIFIRLLRAQARLEETIRRTETLSLMGEMAASVAHEIKNPLGIIRATAERIRTRHGSGDEIFDYIPEEVDRLDAILGAYLDFARRGGVVGSEPSDVGDVSENVLRLVRRDLESSGIRTRIGVGSGIRVAVGAGDLQQVLLNLVLNARQAMREGGELTVTARREGDTVTLQVGDTGVGIAPDDLGKIFRPFYSGRERGSGLGLAIVHRVVTDAGGSVAVESEPGRGTTFTIRLPAEKP